MAIFRQKMLQFRVIFLRQFAKVLGYFSDEFRILAFLGTFWLSTYGRDHLAALLTTKMMSQIG